MPVESYYHSDFYFLVKINEIIFLNNGSSIIDSIESLVPSIRIPEVPDLDPV